MANKWQIALCVIPDLIRDLAVVVNVDLLPAHISVTRLYEILKQVQDDTIAAFNH